MIKSFFYPKLFSVLKKGYGKRQLMSDLTAGTIVGIVALPLAIAFAIASGVTPDKGLMTAIIAGFIISVLGGSRVQIGGPTGAFVVIVYSIIQQYGLDGLIISTILAGIILVVFGLLRLGVIIKLIPYPLIVGFTSGIAVVIFTSQIKDFLGLQIQNIPSEFHQKWISFAQHIQTINIYAVIISVITVFISWNFGKISKKVPGSIVAILLCTLAVTLFHLPVETIGSKFGDIPASFQKPVFPTLSFNSLMNYIKPAFTIAILGAIESLLSAVVSDGMISSNHRSNTELIAQGIANVFSGLFGGIPATGAIARTATNIKNGGRTPVAGITHAVVLLLIMLFFGRWAKLIPMSCLAGILIVVAYNMSEWKSFLSIMRGSRYDISVLLATFILTVFVDLTFAIEVGIVLASFLFMRRMSLVSQVSPVDVRTFDTDIEGDTIEEYVKLKGIEVYEINGPFFFGAAHRFKDVLSDIHEKSKIIIIRMRRVPFIDATGIHNFREMLKEFKKRKKTVLLSGVNSDVYRELQKARIVFLVGKANIFDHFRVALIRANELMANSEKKKR